MLYLNFWLNIIEFLTDHHHTQDKIPIVIYYKYTHIFLFDKVYFFYGE